MQTGDAATQQDGVNMAPLRIGDAVPEFTARSTHGMVRLSDFRGRWLIFFSHPADFTPVCTSEFMSLAKQAPRFAAMDCALVGHSVDSLFSHLAWIRAIRDDLGISVPFPIVEDPTLEIARAFGMIPADVRHASTVRAVYFIDPDGVLAASTAYPVSVGRSVEEMLRILAALQRTHGESVMTPEGWQPGDGVLAPPCFTAEDALAAERPTGWFYRQADQA
jgi:peroxiredoxin (alkyl hydroperoxide reductase subunit C)